MARTIFVYVLAKTQVLSEKEKAFSLVLLVKSDTQACTADTEGLQLVSVLISLNPVVVTISPVLTLHQYIPECSVSTTSLFLASTMYVASYFSKRIR